MPTKVTTSVECRFSTSALSYILYTSVKHATEIGIWYLDSNADVRCSWNGELVGLRGLMYREAC